MKNKTDIEVEIKQIKTDLAVLEDQINPEAILDNTEQGMANLKVIALQIKLKRDKIKTLEEVMN